MKPRGWPRKADSCINEMMKNSKKPLASSSDEGARMRRLVAMHLQQIEGNPLTAEEIAMFEMFEKEGWSHARRLAYINERVNAGSLNPAAE